ncbi:MAG: hypothetical protein IKW20_08630 [Bacteroidales bacterium]|nr:hypothetical protein [Bacteroidales bacterium]
MHGSDPKVLYIPGHDAVYGDLGYSCLFCEGAAGPVKVVFAEVAPFAPLLNGHSEEVRAITALPDLGTADADVIGLLLKRFLR